MNLDKKLTLTHLGSILLFATVITLLGDQIVRESLVDAGREKLRLLSNDVVSDFNRELQDHALAVSNIIDSRAMSIYLNDFDERPLLDILRQQEVPFDSLSLINEQGMEELRYASGAMQAGTINYHYEEDLLDARWTPNTPIVKLHLADAERPARLVISQVKRDFFDEFGGSIRAQRQLHRLFADLLDPPKHTFLLIVTANNQLVYSTKTNGWQPASGQPLGCQLAADEPVFTRCGGRDVFVMQHPLTDDGWKLVAGIPADIFLEPLHRTRNQVLWVLGLLVVLVLLISLGLSRHIQRPLSKLVTASRALAEGKRDVSVRIRRRDELGELGQAFNDMSEKLQASNRRIEYMAYNDELTSLPNRRLMVNRLEKALASGIRHGHRGALMMLDLDRFKNINDSLGHAAGDQLLREVGQRLSSIVREEDTVCRLGGDEFVVLLPEIDKDGDDIIGPTTMVASKILDRLGDAYQLGNSHYVTTASIGVVLFPHLDDSPENLIKRADAAMYRAKQDGGNRIAFYEKAIQQAADERLALEKDLRQAFANQAIMLAYQPQCDANGKLIGAEALARWQHPVHGMVPPPKFIDIAEETGLIIPMGNWILEQACIAQASICEASNETTTTMSVNVSALQFRDPGFYDQVIDILDRHRLPHHCLQLELTESALLDDIDNTIILMQRLRSTGIQLSLDDFGTGYSSLSYLSRLPLDEVKIDRVFLLDAQRNIINWAIIEAIIDVAHTLGLRVVAEGVENADELERLANIGCNLFQGYYFAKPGKLSQLKSRLGDLPDNSQSDIA